MRQRHDPERHAARAFSPYWQRPQFTALTQAKWDVLVIMLGTNDANVNDEPPCWGLDCPFAQSFREMIELARGLGTTPAGPRIFIAVPPPLSSAFYYGMNETVINSVFPKLLPQINSANKLQNPVIDVFGALGGKADWNASFPTKGCGTLAFGGPPAPDWKSIPECKYHCGPYRHGSDPWPITCDNCHPSPFGYSVLAAAVKKAIVGAG